MDRADQRVCRPPSRPIVFSGIRRWRRPRETNSSSRTISMAVRTAVHATRVVPCKVQRRAVAADAWSAMSGAVHTASMDWPAAEARRYDQDVRHDVVMLMPPHAARLAVTRCAFVDDQQHAVLVAKPAQHAGPTGPGAKARRRRKVSCAGPPGAVREPVSPPRTPPMRQAWRPSRAPQAHCDGSGQSPCPSLAALLATNLAPCADAAAAG